MDDPQEKEHLADPLMDRIKQLEAELKEANEKLQATSSIQNVRSQRFHLPFRYYVEVMQLTPTES